MCRLMRCPRESVACCRPRAIHFVSFTDAPKLPVAVRRTAPGRSIEQTLPLLIVALVVFLVGAATLAAYDVVRRTTRAAAADRLRAAVHQVSSLSVDAVRRRQQTMAEAANHPAVRALLHGARVGPEVATVLRLILPPDSMQAIEVVDANGTVMATYGALVSPADERVARDGVRSAGELVDAPAWDGGAYAVGDSVFYWTGAPISEGGFTAGYLLQRRRLSNTASVRRQLERLAGAGTRLLIRSNPSGLWLTLDGARVPPPADVIRRPDGLLQYRSADRVPRLAAWDTVAGTPWSFAADVPLSAIAARPRAFLMRMALVSVLLIVVGAGGAWGVSRHYTRPLGEVMHAARAIAAGDYERRVDVRRSDELGTLATAFNAMAADVGEAHAQLSREAERSRALAGELASSNSDLVTSQVATARVARRTARLQSLTAELSRAVTPEQVATVVVEQGSAAVEAVASVLLVASDDGSSLTLVGAAGYPAEVLTLWQRVPRDAPRPLAEAARTAEPVFIRSGEEFRARYPAMPSIAHDGAWASLPLGMEGRLLGAVGWSFGGARTFEEDERRFLTLLAQQCSQALERARLYRAATVAREEAEQARANAEAANRAKSDFLAVMSHELRTPLNAIAGYTELLEMELRGPITPAQRDDLHRIRRSQQHLLSLINDVLHFTKLDAGAARMVLTDVEVDEAIGDLETLVAPQLRARRLAYHFRHCPRSVVVHADRERFQQILLNILSNAIKFTEPGGEIEVWCDEDARSVVRVHVRDTGIGIPADRLEAVFDPFVQGHHTLTRSHDGIGLGLSISRELARQMGGEITVTSTDGAGSVFTLALPRPAAAGKGSGGAGAPRSMRAYAPSEARRPPPR